MANSLAQPATAPADAEAQALLARIDRARLPRHVAIIMDGNGRWARRQGKSRIEGHRAGVKSVRETVTACRELGVEVLTLYAFSMENWQRPRLEVRALMRFLNEFLERELATMQDNHIRLATIGRTERLPDAVRATLDRVMAATAANTGMTLVLALAYGGRAELTDAVRAIAREVKAGTLNPDAISEATISARLDTAGLPDPDLMIRTSGETRISNYLLWQMAYTEFHFTPLLWPEFRRPALYRAILDYQGRERRFGLTGEQAAHGA
ncbi:MAG: isoprenyl transferase [Nitrospirae bacterium]|nr:isoprenyl transferase [Nitrospirota bacterium]